MSKTASQRSGGDSIDDLGEESNNELDELIIGEGPSQHFREVPAGLLRQHARSGETGQEASVSSASSAAELLDGVLHEIASLLEEMPPISEDKAWQTALLVPLYDTVKLYSDREAAFRHFLEVVSAIVVSARQVLSQAARTSNTAETTRQEAAK